MGIDGVSWLAETTRPDPSEVHVDRKRAQGSYENGLKQTPDIEEIRQLEKTGVLGWEQCPEPDYWHWPVNKPDQLPERFRAMYEAYGEIRW